MARKKISGSGQTSKPEGHRNSNTGGRTGLNENTRGTNRPPKLDKSNKKD